MTEKRKERDEGLPDSQAGHWFPGRDFLQVLVADTKLRGKGGSLGPVRVCRVSRELRQRRKARLGMSHW